MTFDQSNFSVVSHDFLTSQISQWCHMTFWPIRFLSWIAWLDLSGVTSWPIRFLTGVA